MSETNRVDLDASRLLGFRLQGVTSRAGKVGTKDIKDFGQEPGADALRGVRIGGKIGDKGIKRDR